MTTAMDRSLTSVLSPGSAFTLAYAIPLLLISLLLTFAGSFLTLDRTRSFAPKYDTVPGSYKKAKSYKFPLEGGVGGLAIGYAFGVHLATFLSLIVPAKSTYKPLSSASFLAVWVLTCLITIGLAGRWKYAALTFAGISGGTLFSLGFSVLIHPALLTRVILVSVLAPTLTVLCLLPLTIIQHFALRFATAATGAFGTVIAISLLATIPGWSNVWERLWEPVDPGTNTMWTWGTSKEKSLSAGWAVLLVAGIVVNIVLHRMMGECPDEKWDNYLANYSTNFPDRPGTYRPPTTVLGRLLGGAKSSKSMDLAFPHPPSMDGSKQSIPLSPTMQKHDPDSYEFNMPQGFLKKGRSTRSHSSKTLVGGRKGREVKFKPLGELEMISSSDEEDDLHKSPTIPARPWLKQKASLASTNTLVEGDGSKDKASKTPRKSEIPDYSDYEDEHITASKRTAKKQSVPGENWSPGFLKTQQRSSTAHTQSTTDSQKTATPAGAVPATPSLINALDRIALAQKDAFTPTSPTSSATGGLPNVSDERERSKDGHKPASPSQDVHWTGFWKDARRKERET